MSSRYKRAVGLSYREGIDTAPVLGVSGRSENADLIVRLAKRFSIPVIERPELAAALSELQLDERIPEPLYEAVALVLAELDRPGFGKRA